MMKEHEIYERHVASIAQGCLTNSKHPRSFVDGVYPRFIKNAAGCMVEDIENNKYFDFIQGLGAGFMGYGNPLIGREVERHIYSGISVSLPTIHEIEAAEEVKTLFTFIDKVKFLKTGTEACMGAVKIARAATGRKIVLSEGYHGWSDMFVSMTPPHHGVPIDQNMKQFNSGAMQEYKKDLAAIILEPVITDWSDERKKQLKKIRDFCTENGTVLIFDEVITGFRFKKHSVSNYFGVIPDIIILGKAIAGGFPLSVIGGKKEIMECADYFISSTFAGEVISLVAAKTVINLLKNDGRFSIDQLWDSGLRFINEFNTFASGKVELKGYPTRGAFSGEDINIAIFMQEACKARMLFCKSWFYNFDLAKYEKHLLSVLSDIFTRIKTTDVKLEGKMPTSPFAARVRNA